MSATRKKMREVGVNEFGRRIGEWHPSAVLSDAEVDLMRELHEQEDDPWGYTRLAEHFGISRTAVRDICNYSHRAQTAVRFKKV